MELITDVQKELINFYHFCGYVFGIAEEDDDYSILTPDKKEDIEMYRDLFYENPFLRSYIFDLLEMSGYDKTRFLYALKKAKAGKFVFLESDEKEALLFYIRDYKFFKVVHGNKNLKELSEFAPFICETAIIPYRRFWIHDGILTVFDYELYPGALKDISEMYNEDSKLNMIHKRRIELEKFWLGEEFENYNKKSVEIFEYLYENELQREQDRKDRYFLLTGDVSIQYQTRRDLLSEERPDLRERIAHEGWGKMLLERRNNSGHWGRGFYQPKWISSHYTLLDLRNLSISPDCELVHETLDLIINNEKGEDGGLNPAKTNSNSDVCVNGMALNYFSYFGYDEKPLRSIIDFLLSRKMADGGFNCRSNRQGARHSSLHTTISVLEGIEEYKKNGYSYKLEELLKAEKTSREFILQHKLFRSDKTGEIIDKNFLKLHYPYRWRYDILRALDYFQYAKVPYDKRMQEALDMLIKKRRKDRTWEVNAHHPGKQHFLMEKPGKPSRWNTLRAMRILEHFEMT